MNVWRIILHSDVKNETGNIITSAEDKEKILLKYFLDNNVVAIGWGKDNDDNRSVSAFKNKILPDDLIWIKSEKKYYITKVAKDSELKYSSDDEAIKLDARNQRTNIIWKKIDDNLLGELFNISFQNNWTGPTVQRINSTQAIKFSQKAFNITFGQNFYDIGSTMSGNFNEMLKLLKNNKNLILQGAPGTGKTYTTAELALRVIGAIDKNEQLDHKQIMDRYDNYVNKGQIEFVTFHQSMDYEDFVEGLKPKLIKNEEGKCIGITYKKKDGVFKKICNRAQDNVQEDIDQDNLNKENFDNAWQTLIDKLNEYETIIIPLSTEGKNIPLSFNKTGTGLSARTEKGNTIYCSKGQLMNVFRGDKGVLSGAHDNYRKSIIEYMKKECSLKDYIQSKSPSKETLKYVLIIDEINRGNVSKIFGELISLIEKDKRKPVVLNEDLNGKAYHPLIATLPYSKKRFSVPSNLFIIGTMNTTDRSVGSLDYALRRRFAFYTIKSDRNLVKDSQAIRLYDAVEKFLNDKNNILEMDFSDLMVGHSYFITNDEDDIEDKWKYEIKPLLMEYYKDGIIQINVAEFLKASDFISKFNSDSKDESQDNLGQISNGNLSEESIDGDNL